MASAAASDPLLRLRKVSKIYEAGAHAVVGLTDVDLDIFPADFLAVMGHSGSGKSTMMNILGCLDVPTGGVYEIKGIPVSSLSPEALAVMRNREIGFIFQVFHLLPRYTAQRNVELPLLYAGVGREERAKRAVEALTAVGIEDRKDHLSNELSGGQKQKVAIARALMNGPQVLLCDEPTGNLDSKTSESIYELLFGLKAKTGMSIVIVTHDESLSTRTDEVLRIRDGTVV